MCGSEGQQEADRMEGEKRTEMRNGGQELGRGPLLPTVNNTGRHFNYQQPAQINFYCPLDKDTAAFALVTIHLASPHGGKFLVKLFTACARYKTLCCCCTDLTKQQQQQSLVAV